MDRPVVGVAADVEAQFAAHLQHVHILGQDASVKGLQPLAFSVADEVLHKDPPKSLTFQIGTEQDGVFALFIIRIGEKTGDAKRFQVSGSVRRSAMKAISRA